MQKYDFVVDGDTCKIYLKRPAGKYIGSVTKAPFGHSIQRFADGVNWLPVSRALAALGEISQEEAISRELGFF